MYKKRYNSRRIRGKLLVCNYLSSNKKAAALVPHTVRLNRPNLNAMSTKYKSLYIKKDVGSQGVGVYKVKRHPDGYTLYTTKRKKVWHRQFAELSSLYKHLKSQENSKMIIQKAIKLDRIQGRPYDIRSMVQRKPGGSWVCTGYLAKVGAPKKIVTNYYQGGKIYTIENLFKKKGCSKLESRVRIQFLKNKALDIAEILSKKRSGMHEMGIDFAFDKKDRLWIIEVNTNHPQFHPLKELDPAAYRRMLSFGRSYGRKDD